MNTTEDGDEPLGDYLDTPTFVAIVPPQGGPTGIRVIGENERQAIAEIRALHGRAHGVKLSRADIPDDQAAWACGQCMKDGGPHDPADWVEIPCPTIQILDKWGV